MPQLFNVSKALQDGLTPLQIQSMAKQSGASLDQPELLGQQAQTSVMPNSMNAALQPLPDQTQNQDQGPSIKGFFNNLGSDIGQNVQGILSLPGLLGNVLTGKVGLGDVGGAVLGGLKNEYGGLISNPGSAVYNRPLSSFLDVLPFLQLGKASLLGKAGEAGDLAKAAEVAGQAGKTAEVAGEAGNILDRTPFQKIGQAGVVQPLEKVSQGAQMVSDLFTVPSKLAGRLDLPNASSWWLQHDLPIDNFQNMKATSSAISGPNGILTAVERAASGDIPTTVRTSGVSDAVTGILKNPSMSSEIGDLAPQLRQHINDIVYGGENPATAGGGVSALQAVDARQQLEKLGWALKNKSTALTPNIKAEQLGDVYLNAADELQSAIDSAAGKANVLAPYKNDPNIIQRLQSISPKLAQDFQSPEVQTLQDVRSLQKNAVRINNAIDLTENSGRSVLPQSSTRIAGAIGGSAVGGPLGAVLGSILAPIANPVVEGIVQKTRVPLTGMVAKLVDNPNVVNVAEKLGQGASTLGDILKAGAVTGAKAATSPITYNVLRQLQQLQPQPATQPITDLNSILATANQGGQQMTLTPQTQETGQPTTQTPGITITPDMVQRAYLTMPPQLAQRVANAYQAQFGGLSPQTVLARNVLSQQTQQLAQAVDQNSGKLNQITVGASNLGGILGAGDKDIQQLQALLAGYRQRVSSILGGGATSKQLDALFPVLGKDSVQQIKSKLSVLQNLINSTVPFEGAPTQ